MWAKYKGNITKEEKNVQESVLLLKLADILAGENLITPDEKYKLQKLIRESDGKPC